MAKTNLNPSRCSTPGHIRSADVTPSYAPALGAAAAAAAAATTAAAPIDASTSSPPLACAVDSTSTNLRFTPATIAAIKEVIARASATRRTATLQSISGAGKAARSVRKPRRWPRITRARPVSGVGEVDTNSQHPSVKPVITADEKAMLLEMISHLRGLKTKAERAAAVKGFTVRQLQLFSWYQKECRRLRSGKRSGFCAINGAMERSAASSSGAHLAAVRRAAIARQLKLLIHASHCRDSQCKVEHCSTMKTVLGHMTDCQAGWSCTHPHCASSRAIIQHYSRCRVTVCPICPGGAAGGQAKNHGSGGDEEGGFQ